MGLVESGATVNVLPYEVGVRLGAVWWDGYEFLEASRDESLWNKALQQMRSKGGGLVFEVLKQVLISWTKDAVLRGTL